MLESKAIRNTYIHIYIVSSTVSKRILSNGIQNFVNCFQKDPFEWHTNWDIEEDCNDDSAKRFTDHLNENILRDKIKLSWYLREQG